MYLENKREIGRRTIQTFNHQQDLWELDYVHVEKRGETHDDAFS